MRDAPKASLGIGHGWGWGNVYGQAWASYGDERAKAWDWGAEVGVQLEW